MKKFGAILLAILLLLGNMQVFASEYSCVSIRGSAEDYNKWTKITLETGKNWLSNKITFTQTKGTMSRLGIASQTYGAYTIKVRNHSTGVTQTYYWKYSKNYSIKLKDNTTYTIQIKPYLPSTIGDQRLKNKNLSSLIAQGLKGYSKDYWEWSNPPKWSIKSTRAVDWCYSSSY